MSSQYWNDDPDRPVADWQAEVVAGDTRLGYHEWRNRRTHEPKCLLCNTETTWNHYEDHAGRCPTCVDDDLTAKEQA